MKLPAISLFALLGSAITSQALIINFGAATTNIVADEFGLPLAASSLVQVGTWNGSIFTPLKDTVSDPGLPGSFAGSSDNLNTTAIAGQQLAIRWFDTTDNSGFFGIAYSNTPAWKVVSSDATEIVPVSQGLDIGDLTTNSGMDLAGTAVLINATFGPAVTPDSYGIGATPVFQMIPEPSTYAALAGALALGLVAWKRRRA